MNIYSDLAIEIGGNIPGNKCLKREEYVEYGINCVKLEIKNNKESQIYARKKGKYFSYEHSEGGDIIKALAQGLKNLLSGLNGEILLVGLGNPKYSADALGDICLENIDIGKHGNYFVRKINPLTSGETGIESYDIIKAAVKIIKPNAIIAIDTLATSTPKRLGMHYQITNAGLVPGGGVKNARKPITKENFGTPIIAIGVPLVTYAEAIVKDYVGREIECVSDFDYRRVIVTPSSIDELVKSCAKNISASISLALE